MRQEKHTKNKRVIARLDLKGSNVIKGEIILQIAVTVKVPLLVKV